MTVSIPPTAPAPPSPEPAPRSYQVTLLGGGKATHEADDIAIIADGVLELHLGGWLTAAYAPGHWHSLQQLTEQETTR